jgi:hypothetical protein
VVKRAAEPIPAWAKADGHRRRQRASAVGVCSGIWVVASREWSASQSREGLVVARLLGQAQSEARGDGETGGSGRSSDDAVGQQNPGRAKDPWGSGVTLEARTSPDMRGSAAPTGISGRVDEGDTKRASNRRTTPGQDARDAMVRFRYLEAVLGKTRRTEFQRGQRKRSDGAC